MANPKQIQPEQTDKISLFKTLGHSLSRILDTSITTLDSSVRLTGNIVGSVDYETRKLFMDSQKDYDHEAYKQAWKNLKMD